MPSFRCLWLSAFRYLAPLFAVLFLSDCPSFASDVHVRGHFRSNGTYVQPHYRSASDGYFYNNWSTLGNINPYTGRLGTKKQPSNYYSNYRSAPPLPQFPPASSAFENAFYSSNSSQYSNAVPQQDVEVIARAIATVELERELELQQDIEIQFRKAAEEKIATESLARQNEFEHSEALRHSEFLAQISAAAKIREQAWQEEHDAWSKAAIAAARADITAYSRSQDEKEIETKELEQTQAQTAAIAVANARQIVCERYRGDGREAIRERQRQREDAWANARRAVQAKYAAQARSADRSRNNFQFESEVCARLKNEAIRREEAWLTAERALQHDTESQFAAASQVRRGEWQRNEARLVAQAKSKLEADVLQLKQSYVRKSLPGGSPSDSKSPVEEVRQSPPNANHTAGAGTWPQVIMTAVVAALFGFIKLKT